MPLTYQLFPGLKQILEDKRIRHFGVPKEDYDDYLKAEQFVVDLRDFGKKDAKELDLTYDALSEMGLDKLPYEKIVVHALARISNEHGQDIDFGISSYYFFGKRDASNNELAYYLFEDPYLLAISVERFNKDTNYQAACRNYVRTVKRSIVVMLATRNIVKERKESKSSQASINGKPHKKGSGGYTLLRPPEAHEVGDGTGTHASPRPHFRRGHIRKLHPEDKTRWVFVAPCFVNGEPAVQRKAYLG